MEHLPSKSQKGIKHKSMLFNKKGMSNCSHLWMKYPVFFRKLSGSLQGIGNMFTFFGLNFNRKWGNLLDGRPSILNKAIKG